MPATIGRCRKVYESRAIAARSRPTALVNRCSAAIATTSKYSHHSAIATLMPSTEATMMGHEIGRPSTPTPIETTDSPSAMMMISPCRSAKWAGDGTTQPLVPASSTPP